MNNKGFTLVEILSVIVLIGLLLGIGVPGVMRISERMKERGYNTKVDLIEQAGILWGQDNKTRLQTNTCDIDGDSNTSTGTDTYGREYNCHIITINELIDEDYLEADSDVITEKTVGGKTIYEYEYFDPRNNTNIYDKCVWVYKKNNRVYAKYGIGCNGYAT